MEDSKKRKLDEAGNGDVSSREELRLLLEPLAKPQLVDLLSKLYALKLSNPSAFVCGIITRFRHLKMGIDNKMAFFSS